MTVPEIAAILAPSMALMTAVIGGILAYRSQIRLKSFELLLVRRAEILRGVEERIELYRNLMAELGAKTDAGNRPHLEKFKRTEFHDGLMLYHRCYGGAFGPLAEVLLDTYFHCLQQSLMTTFDYESLQSYAEGQILNLAMFYGSAHRRMTGEIEEASLSWLIRLKRAIGIKEKLRIQQDDETKHGSGGQPRK